MTKEIVTLSDLENFGGLLYNQSDIESVINLAKRSNEFYVGTDVNQWLKSLNTMVDNEMIERFSIIDDNDEIIEGSYKLHEFEEILWDNSYNWGGNSSCDIDFKVLQSVQTDAMYAYIRVHLGGDIRGNYSEGILVDMDSYLESSAWLLFEDVHEYGNGGYVEYEGTEYSVNGNITSEWIEVYNHETHDSFDIASSVYCFNEEEFKQELIEIIKEVID